LKSDIHVNNIYKSSSYLTENVLRLRYKNQPVNAAYGNIRCLLCERYIIKANAECFLTLKWVVSIATTDLERVKIHTVKMKLKHADRQRSVDPWLANSSVTKPLGAGGGVGISMDGMEYQWTKSEYSWMGF
jgi:hypothetical protein